MAVYYKAHSCDINNITVDDAAASSLTHKQPKTVKVVPNLAAEQCRKSMEFLRPGTNGTQLQLIRSCAFLLDPGVPISGSECRVLLEPDRFSDVRMCVKEQVGIKWV